ncbi:GNAT family N-acetyltransferase [Salipaludibacillus sp. LMS25]|uniref:GNAT family N-acetyltransferase n=1 Tax=Salipaludibacillus sp. LMS25 TaxID=2924031 RepID=UPI0020D09A3D|nr:GNAT family N-acetyltransferase [Salipaludibacillus sp. LMS25]UTR14728.1 GNAT family N-acetyltransferase [Salipaludibacillus sp. LMS25]
MITLRPLTMDDCERLFCFEKENKSFFELMVPPRPDSYNTKRAFKKIVEQLIDEQNRQKSYFYLIMNNKDDLVGRLNITDINNECGNIGYRIGENYCGQGLASKALKQFLLTTPDLPLKCLKAKTTNHNISSQRVLEKNQFYIVKEDIQSFLFNKHHVHFIHFQWDRG